MSIEDRRCWATGTVLALLASVVVLTGCDRSESSTPAASATPSSPPSPSQPDVPPGMGFLNNVCDGQTYRDSPAYDGPGPHLIYLTGIIPTAGLNKRATSDNAGDYALVGCISHVAGPYYRDCSYNEASKVRRTFTQRLVRGDIQIKLIEVRTGRQVAQITVRGKPDPVCQYVLPPGSSDGDIQYGAIDEDAVSRAIAPYARRTV